MDEHNEEQVLEADNHHDEELEEDVVQPEHTTTQGGHADATNLDIDCGNAGDSSVASGSNSSSASVNNQPAQEHSTVLSREERDQELILELQWKVRMLRKWNLKLTREIKKMRQDASAEEAKSTGHKNPNAYQAAVLGAISVATQRCNRRMNSSRTGALVAKAVWNHGSFQPHLLKLACKHFREKSSPPTTSYEKWIWREELCRMKELMFCVELRPVV
ncbi:hypothetical protein MHU86_11648 [Fragilaria crotonensis]|nr:hypothetical protein MHU86_11648 [Fragilaria crotonensis]